MPLFGCGSKSRRSDLEPGPNPYKPPMILNIYAKYDERKQILDVLIRNLQNAPLGSKIKVSVTFTQRFDEESKKAPGFFGRIWNKEKVEGDLLEISHTTSSKSAPNPHFNTAYQFQKLIKSDVRCGQLLFEIFKKRKNKSPKFLGSVTLSGEDIDVNSDTAYSLYVRNFSTMRSPLFACENAKEEPRRTEDDATTSSSSTPPTSSSLSKPQADVMSEEQLKNAIAADKATEFVECKEHEELHLDNKAPNHEEAPATDEPDAAVEEAQEIDYPQKCVDLPCGRGFVPPVENPENIYEDQEDDTSSTTSCSTKSSVYSEVVREHPLTQPENDDPYEEVSSNPYMTCVLPHSLSPISEDEYSSDESEITVYEIVSIEQSRPEYNDECEGPNSPDDPSTGIFGEVVDGSTSQEMTFVQQLQTTTPGDSRYDTLKSTSVVIRRHDADACTAEENPTTLHTNIIYTDRSQKLSVFVRNLHGLITKKKHCIKVVLYTADGRRFERETASKQGSNPYFNQELKFKQLVQSDVRGGHIVFVLAKVKGFKKEIVGMGIIPGTLLNLSRDEAHTTAILRHFNDQIPKKFVFNQSDVVTEPDNLLRVVYTGSCEQIEVYE